MVFSHVEPILLPLFTYLAWLLVAAAVAAGPLYLFAHHVPSETALMRDRSKDLLWGPLWHARRWTAWVLERGVDWVSPSGERAVQLAGEQGFVRTQVLSTLVDLEVTDLIGSGGGAQTAQQLAARVQGGVHSAADLKRVLSLAAALGILSVDADKDGEPRFRNTYVSATLRKDHPNSIRSVVILQATVCSQSWPGLSDGLKSGTLPFAAAHPAAKKHGGFYKWLQAEPSVADNFREHTEAVDAYEAVALLVDFQWGRFRRFVDIGGGGGSLLARLMSSQTLNPGMLLDLPHVVQQTKADWARRNPKLLERTQFVAGDLLSADAGEVIPAAEGPRDAFILRAVLQNFSDRDASLILKAVRQALGDSGAKVLIVEAVPAAGVDRRAEVLRRDVNMLAMTGGQLRSASQWRPLLADAGLALRQVSATRSAWSVVEASAA